MQDSIYKFMKVELIHFMACPQVVKREGLILAYVEHQEKEDKGQLQLTLS